MKSLIIVKHGVYQGRGGSGCPLADLGRQQISSLRDAVLPYLQVPTVALSSPFLRTKQSAEILVGDLPIALEITELLESGGGVPTNCAAVWERIKDVPDGTVLLVTHFEYGYALPNYIAKYVWNRSYRSPELPNGRAWVLDMQEKTVRLC